MTWIFTENVTLSQVFFKHFASKNQLSGLSVSGTLVENGLREKIPNPKNSRFTCNMQVKLSWKMSPIGKRHELLNLFDSQCN